MARFVSFLSAFALCVSLALAQQCLPYTQRIDCHPDPESSKEACLARGCEYCEGELPNWNIPTCYLPSSYGYKMEGQPVDTGHGFRVTLVRATNITLFGSDSQVLTLEVDFQADYRLRVKITDGSNRFQVPIQIDPPKGGNSNLLYDVQISNDPVFSFKVIRKSSGAVLFDTSLGGLTFADQFLQLSTKLPTDNLFGIGENEQTTFKHNFEKFPVWPLFSRDQTPAGNANMYGVQPHYTVLEKDGSAHAVAWINSNAQEFVLLPAPGVLYRTVGGIIDLLFLLGPTPENTVQQYSEAVGRTKIPPYWALGFQLCKYGYDSLQNMQEAVERLRQYQIPHDVQYGDIDIMDGNRDFTVSPVNFAGLAEYVQTLKARGMKFITILDPGIGVEPNSSYRPYDLGEEMDVWIRRPDGKPAIGRVWPEANVAFPDFSKNSTRQWWITLIKEFHEILEWDALWIDMNEPINFITGDVDDGCPVDKYNNPPYVPKIMGGYLSERTVCMNNEDSVSLQYNTHSLYGWFESEPTVAGILAARPGKRAYALSRSTYLGTGRWVSHWLGDNFSRWSNLKTSIIGILQFNQWGIPFIGPDICGHNEEAEAQLCQRWQELGAFFPFSRNHNGRGHRDQDPGAFGPEVAESSRKALEIRYTLLPYIYTLFYYHELEGSTVARALWHEYPTDPVALNIDEQFLLGPGLMISPVLEANKTTVDVYFPDSRWYDYYKGTEVFSRGLVSTLTAPLDYINVHLRGGVIYPTQEPAVNTELSRLNPMGITVALDDNNSAEGRLFFDDGDVLDPLDSGAYYLVHHIYENGTLTSDVENNGYPVMSTRILDSIRLLGAREDITRVSVNGRHIKATRSASGEIIVKGLGLNPTENHRIVFE